MNICSLFWGVSVLCFCVCRIQCVAHWAHWEMNETGKAKLYCALSMGPFFSNSCPWERNECAFQCTEMHRQAHLHLFLHAVWCFNMWRWLQSYFYFNFSGRTYILFNGTPIFWNHIIIFSFVLSWGKLSLNKIRTVSDGKKKIVVFPFILWH